MKRKESKMFEGLKGLGSLAGLMKDLPKLKAKMEQVKERLGQITVEAETGGGAVRATANGQLRLLSVRVDQALLSGLVDAANPEDRMMAEDLIVGAVNAALEKAREAAEAEMKNVATEVGLPLPPGGLEGLMP
jgi:DNA-binding YbaB/EbfC family protein